MASDRLLINFVLIIALAEVVTTILFLDALRSDLALAAFGLIGLIVAVSSVGWAAARFGPQESESESERVPSAAP